jgi:hypothetical protein
MRPILLVGSLVVLVGCTEDGTFPRTYSSGSAAVVGDELRVAMRSSQYVAVTRAHRGESAAPPIDVRIDGVPLEGFLPQIAAIGDRTYLVWGETHNHETSYRGAPLRDDATIDGSTILELGPDLVELHRLGDRLLVVSTPETPIILPSARTLTGTWIEPDGRRAFTAELGRIGGQFAMASDPDGSTGMWALAYPRFYSNVGADLLVARVLSDGTALDPDGLTIARSTDTAGPGTLPTDLALAMTPGGSLLVAYTMTAGASRELHVADIPRDGAITDRIVPLPDTPELVVRGDRVLALTRDAADDRTVPIAGRVLDRSGAVVSGPVDAGTVIDGDFDAFAVGTGFALLQRRSELVIHWLGADGRLEDTSVAATE